MGAVSEGSYLGIEWKLRWALGPGPRTPVGMWLLTLALCLWWLVSVLNQGPRLA